MELNSGHQVRRGHDGNEREETGERLKKKKRKKAVRHTMSWIPAAGLITICVESHLKLICRRTNSAVLQNQLLTFGLMIEFLAVSKNGWCLKNVLLRPRCDVAGRRTE